MGSFLRKTHGGVIVTGRGGGEVEGPVGVYYTIPLAEPGFLGKRYRQYIVTGTGNCRGVGTEESVTVLRTAGAVGIRRVAGGRHCTPRLSVVTPANWANTQVTGRTVMDISLTDLAKARERRHRSEDLWSRVTVVAAIAAVGLWWAFWLTV